MSNEKNVRFSKECIISALFALMEKMDYETISISALCAEARVGRATFYRHFADKNDVIMEYFKEENRSFAKMQEAVFAVHKAGLNARNDRVDIRENIYPGIYSIFTLLEENKKKVQLIIKAGLELIYLNYLNEAISTYFEQQQYDTSIYSPYYFIGSFFNVSMQWVRNGCRESPETMADMFVEHLFIPHMW